MVKTNGGYKYLYLNRTGTEIWQYILEMKPVKEIIEILAEKYNKPHNVIQNDVIEFIKNLESRDIISLVSIVGEKNGLYS